SSSFSFFLTLIQNAGNCKGLEATSARLQALQLGTQYFRPWRTDQKGIEQERKSVAEFCSLLVSHGFTNYLSTNDHDDKKLAELLPKLLLELQASIKTDVSIFGYGTPPGQVER